MDYKGKSVSVLPQNIEFFIMMSKVDQHGPLDVGLTDQEMKDNPNYFLDEFEF